MSKKFLFSLVGVNFEKVDQKYGIVSAPTTTDDDGVIPENTTKIFDLDSAKKLPDVISFLDETKKFVKCSVSMIDFKSGRGIDGKTRYKCFWDKNTIPDTWQPLGCPIRYIPSRVAKTYHSEISKETHTITEQVSEKRRIYLNQKKDANIVTETKDYYETDGVFCSFNCCMAYLQDLDNKRNPLYQQSETLLLKMYNDINGNPSGDVREIMPAPHWRNLIDFGGQLSIEKFRDTFNKVKYQDHGIISYVSLGRLYEDKIKF